MQRPIPTLRRGLRDGARICPVPKTCDCGSGIDRLRAPLQQSTVLIGARRQSKRDARNVTQRKDGCRLAMLRYNIILRRNRVVTPWHITSGCEPQRGQTRLIPIEAAARPGDLAPRIGMSETLLHRNR